jgi:hypothetical protein
MKNRSKDICLALVFGLTATAVAVAEDEKAATETKPSSELKATPDAKAPRAASRQHWAYQRVQSPALPSVRQKDWVRTPIDAFVLAKLEEKNLAPSPDADRALFIRRATLDTWGLIPTPEEVAAFVDDKSPEAYERLVARLLASPRYGERQARLWLDLARYADSAGFQNDQVRPNMWRYRDYVIKAFNQDKPYNRFIQEQIAGDEIAPGNEEALIATGFLVGYPDNANSRDLIQRKYQITTDITDTIGQAVLGSTIGCARCHNHKSDKFTQKDYFSFQAFFANTSINEKIPATVGPYEREYESIKAKYDEAVKDIKAKQKALVDSVRQKAETYHKERYLPDSRASIFKAQDQWNALDRWVNHRVSYVTTDNELAQYLRYSGEDKDSPDYNKENLEKWSEYRKLTEDLKKFDKLNPTKGSKNISAVTELGHADAPPTYVFFGGNHERAEEEVQPAFPDSLTSERPVIVSSEISSGRRAALAGWLSSPDNPLTARVFVNRAWNQYFVKGIVGTVSDFGKAGDRPTNQELLDYLADSFVRSGWSVKALHRQILLSSVYRQSSEHREDAYKADPENKLLAVFPRKRLDAEQVRDSLLVASGKLVEQIGGPSVFAPVPANLNAGPLWPVSDDPKDHNRRSLYIFTRRSVPYPLLEPFDMASAQQVHSKRDVTTTPLQALTLINSDQIFRWSQSLAGRIIREGGNDESRQLDRLYQILFARVPTSTEKSTLFAFLDGHGKSITEKALDGRLTLAIPIDSKEGRQQDPVRSAALVDLVHAVVNSNEFIYRF